MKLYIMNDGDSSVGLQGFNIELDITDKDDILTQFDEPSEFINRLKQFFIDELSGLDGKTVILTDKELDNEVNRLDNLNEGF